MRNKANSTESKMKFLQRNEETNALLSTQRRERR